MSNASSAIPGIFVSALESQRSGSLQVSDPPEVQNLAEEQLLGIATAPSEPWAPGQPVHHTTQPPEPVGPVPSVVSPEPAHRAVRDVGGHVEINPWARDYTHSG
jgi:hypothetical protein